MGNYPVTVARHHIVPANLLIQLWNTMLDRGHMASANGGGYATALLASMALNLAFYEINMVPGDRLNLLLLLNGIQFGYLEHDPNAGTVPNRDLLAEAYEWLPGNLFIGPDGTWRDDDPGDNFETNAGIVVGNGFRQYSNANQRIQAYLAGTATTPSRAVLSLARIALTLSPFPLNPLNWFSNVLSGKFSLNTQPQLELQSQLQESVAAE
jgi:hypothetical protein